MELSYSTIVNGNTNAYPGRMATVVKISGGPFRVPYLSPGESETPQLKEDTSFFVNFISQQREEDGETSAVVFSGVEPLWQGNALLKLCSQLKALGFFIKVETSGFYAEDLRALLPHVSHVSLDLKHKLTEPLYAPMLGSRVSFTVFYSNLLKAMAFLENAPVYKEVTTTVIPGVNDSADVFDSISRQVKNFADQYALLQFTPFPKPLADPVFEKISPPTRASLLTLAQVARSHVGRVIVRCFESEDQEVLLRAQR